MACRNEMQLNQISRRLTKRANKLSEREPPLVYTVLFDQRDTHAPSLCLISARFHIRLISCCNRVIFITCSDLFHARQAFLAHNLECDRKESINQGLFMNGDDRIAP